MNVRTRNKIKHTKRAETLHALFLQFSQEIKRTSLHATYPAMRAALRGKRISFSFPSCYRLFNQWKSVRTPAAVAHRYNPSLSKVFTNEECRAVIAAAVALRITVIEACQTRTSGPSYRVIAYRFPKACRMATKLVYLETRRRQLARSEQRILDVIATA